VIRLSFDDRNDLSFSDHVVELNKDSLDSSCRRRRDRNFHLHGFDKSNLIAVADIAVGCNRKTAHAARDFGGVTGVFTSAAMLGLTDVDALTVSMAREASQDLTAPVAAAAIALGVLSNTGLKLGLALVLGSQPFRLVTGGTLTAILAMLGATLAFWRG